MRRRDVLCALVVGFVVFLLYRATLLPGVDFGDTGSLQTTVGTTFLTPRDGYPLYFALGNAFLWLTRAEPAHAMNLASAVEAATACAVMVLAAVELAGSLPAAVAAALLFATSYTFWSQAVIAEVYALHIALVALTLLLLLRWSRAPNDTRLFAFFAVYAVAFGNHLSMILLAPAFTLFLLASAPGGWKSMFAPRIVGLAAGCAVAGALQYAWNLHTLWLLPNPPHGPLDALQRFWFDVTKSDWRDTMVMTVPRALIGDRSAMYWFDLRQQFGTVVPVVAVAGLVALARLDIRRAWLMVTAFCANALFAYSYNVGDTHVFYLPSHLIVALLVAPAIAAANRLTRSAGAVAAAVLIAYAAARGYRDFPALDRSGDDRPGQVLRAFTDGVDDRRSILLADLNWQVQNGLSYFSSVTRPEIAWARMPDVILYAPALIADNLAIGREVLLTERARATAAAAYGPLIPTVRDNRVDVPPLSAAADRLPQGTRYVLCVLRPSRDLPLDRGEIDRLLERLGAGIASLPDADYVAMAGQIGQPATLVEAGMRPFDSIAELNGVPIGIRMESWLAFDTIRRMGFGHVIAARQHTLTVERGVSFVAFDDRGRPLATAYRSNIFAPQPRYLVSILR